MGDERGQAQREVVVMVDGGVLNVGTLHRAAAPLPLSRRTRTESTPATRAARSATSKTQSAWPSSKNQWLLCTGAILPKVSALLKS